MMLDSGEIPSSTSPESMTGTLVKDTSRPRATPVIPAGSRSKKRKLYTGSPEVQEGDKADVDKAVKAATDAFK